MPIDASALSGADTRLKDLRRVQCDLRWTGRRDERLLPVPAALTGLLPGGGLVPGSTYSVTPGALLLALLAEPSRGGSWCGVIGLPELGAEAAEQAGLSLDRLALVPHPGERWFTVLATLAEVVPVVAVRPGGRVRDGDAARLAARLRSSESVLLVAGPWPRAEATLSMSAPRWSGIGPGHGYVTARDVLVTITSKRLPAPRQARLALPDAVGGLSAAPAATSQGGDTPITPTLIQPEAGEPALRVVS